MKEFQKINMGTSEDRPLEAAQWAQIFFLLSGNELTALLQKLMPMHIVKTRSREKKGKSIIPLEEFLFLYREYVDLLMHGSFPDPQRYKGIFSSIITKELDAVFATKVDDDSEIIQLKKPVIQMQYHTITWSKEEGKFRSQLFGKESIPWGLLFSYPQIILEPHTKEIKKVGDNYPNSSLFKTIQLWQRENTIPTPFLTPQKRINAFQRIGKECLEWINNHPSFKELHISVSTERGKLK